MIINFTTFSINRLKTDIMFTNRFKKAFPQKFPGIIRFLIWIRLGPNHLSIIGGILALAAGLLLACGNFISGGLCILCSGFCDMFDGTLARNTGTATKFGKFLDSVVDRYSELAIFFGLIFYFAHQTDMLFEEITGWFSLTGSLMVSYTKARAEAVGVNCRIGIMQRPERMIVLIIATILTGLFDNFLIAGVSLFLLALFSNITALQRIFYTRNKMNTDDKTHEP